MFHHALTRSIASTLQNALPITHKVDIDTAHRQHHEYIQILRRFGIQVHVLEALEEFPDSVFVEDDAIVIGTGTVLISRLGHESRRGEAKYMRAYFEKHTDLKIVDMNQNRDAEATLDGGDVLWVFGTKEIFVGESKRTNKGGIAILQEAFPEFQVHTVQVRQGLHLKTFATALPPPTGNNKDTAHHILISGCDIGRELWKIMSSCKTESRIEAVFSPEQDACNVVVFPRRDLDDTEQEEWIIMMKAGYSKSETFLNETVRELNKQGSMNARIETLEYDELSKKDGCLTCCSVLW